MIFIENSYNYHNREIGIIGEKEAARFLRKIGYVILSQNFYTREGEIDIVAKDKNEYIFIEVKTRVSKKYGNPVEAVNKAKEKHILLSSKYYIYKYRLQNKFIRFDIIEVYIDGKNKFINHIKNVFF